MGLCRDCNVETEGKFCGECGKPVDDGQAESPQTTTVTWCESCDAQMPDGKFCGECGSLLGQKEVEAKKKAAYVGTFGDEQRKAAQQAASNPVKTIPTNTKPSGGYVGSFGDEQRKKAQQASSTTGGYNKFGGASSGYAGGFGDDQRKKAQQAASNPVKTIPTNTKPSGGYVGSFGDEQRRKAQQAASTTGGYNKFSGQKPAAGGGLDFVTASNLEKQKMVNEAGRTKDNIVLSTDKKCEGTVDMQTANALKSQKETSNALKRQDKIVQSTEKKSEGVIDIQTQRALDQQKETHAAMKFVPRGSEGTSQAFQAEEAPAPEYRCEACNEFRAPSKFCQECGSSLVQV